MISRAHFGIDVDQHAVCGLPLAGMTRDRIARRNMHRKSLWHGQTTGVPLPNPHRTGLDLASSGCGCASQQSFGTEILVDWPPTTPSDSRRLATGAAVKLGVPRQ